MDGVIWLLIAVAALAVAIWSPHWGGLARWRNWQRSQRRRRLEDALKHLLTLSQRGQSGSSESLAGALGLSQTEGVALIENMEARGVIHSASGGLQLTPAGERWALQIVRAHRLWERYLADEAGMAFTDLHVAAERAEHDLTAENIEELDAQLGHPRLDPHGDPIPRADGSLEKQAGVPLTDWDAMGTAHIVHIEDEPDIVFRQIVALGFHPGDSIRLLERTADHLVIAHGGNEHRIAPVVAANLHVQAAPLAPSRPRDAITLAELPDGVAGEVVALDPQYRGFARRRLLDLGLTPSATVTPELDNAFGDPRGYRIRGTLIALRSDQARLVWVRPLRAEAATV